MVLFEENILNPLRKILNKLTCCITLCFIKSEDVITLSKPERGFVETKKKKKILPLYFFLLLLWIHKAA